METVGSLIDKLSINELKIYHMKEQLERTDTDRDFREECERKLSILRRQSEDLTEELGALLEDVLSGRRQLRVYRQLKMYNEKKYKD